MNVFELTRALVDIESITDNETAVAEYLYDYLWAVVTRTGGRAERMAVSEKRFNVLASWGQPVVTLSTHMDTVPPFFPSREESGKIEGRGSCDAKGIIAAMIGAAEKLRGEGVANIAVLFVVGEERNSAGAEVAAQQPRGSKYLIDGEPTENKLALASKGALRFEVIASGRAAHSAYPELGDSAIEKLLDALAELRDVPLPTDDVLGACTMNVGTLSGGRAPNVIADHAKAELLVRLVGDADPIRKTYASACGERVELKEVLCVPAMHFARVDGLPTTVVSFTTDVPVFGKSWGEPLLIGPGSIHVAHTAHEFIPKHELTEAVEIYATMTKKLLKQAQA